MMADMGYLFALAAAIAIVYMYLENNE